MSDVEMDGADAPAITDLSSEEVQTKYREAANIANTALQGVITQIAVGKSIVDICEFGDSLIEAQCQKAYKSKHIEKGIAFPTCISVNEIVAHNSPLRSESSSLKEGDIVKM
jgi:methionine aminopeptidase